MRAIALPERPGLRAKLAIGAGTGVLVALALVLWARYGSAAYYEQMAAGLGICF
jgi:hypothetical protein